MKKILLLVMITMVFMSCKEENEDVVATPEKKGGREVVLSSVISGDSTKHITNQKVWLNGVVIKETIAIFSTVNPSKVKDTVENDNGDVNVVEHDTKFPIFVTVK